MTVEARESVPSAEQPEQATVSVQAIRSTLVADVWPHVEPLIAKAVAEGYGEETVADVRERLAGRQYQLWLVLVDGRVAGAVVTTVVLTPRMKICRAVHLAGDGIDAWFEDLVDALSTWAKQLECDALQAFGRAGWQKLMRSVGAKRVSTIYQKELA